jgi:transposase
MRQKKAAQAKWLLSDELWKEIEPLLSPRKPGVKAGRGRPPISDRQAMNGIFFVLKTGCQWRALDVTGICPGSTAHDRFQKWRKAGVFREFWKKGLQKYDECKGIDWEWQSLDASFAKAPVAGSKKNRQKPHRSRQNRHQTLDSDRSSRPPDLDRRR